MDHSSSPVAKPEVPQGTGHLHKSLGPITLWGLGVGYVISGDYFGWNLGLAAGGSGGLLVAYVLMSLMALAFVFSYTEMACAIPRAGGVFVYASRGLGVGAGFLAGTAQAIEFLFAPPAIAMAIGTYINQWLPGIDRRHVALAAYLAFTGLNMWGVRQAAAFELFVTIVAVSGILLFAGVALPHFELAHFTANSMPHGAAGILAAIPFAVWFYVAIEGVANAAEEARHPQRDVALGFGFAIATLVILGGIVLAGCVGVGGWERAVYEAQHITADGDGSIMIAADATPADNPLLLAAGQIVSVDSPLFHALVGIGLLGFVASFNGIVLVAGRALFDMGRVGFLPRALGKAHPRTGTPVVALAVNLAIGVVSIYCFDTAGLITMSALGAVTLYALSMVALFALRRREPDLPRPYRTPLYPLLPTVAMVLAAVAFVLMLYGNFDNRAAPNSFERWISIWYVGALIVAMLYFGAIVRPRLTAEDLQHFRHVD
ncbi:MAG TPA: amino acid permease [Pirellulales bacterium]|nr:amino acid permease [Pirellulales bacterium]